MEKLELKHFAPYLPYGLKMAFIVRDEIRIIDSISNLYDIEEYSDIKLSIGYSFEDHIWMFKPILRPLSDLTKEIEHNGERFVPIEILGWNSYEYIIHEGVCDGVGYQYMLKLFSWHFDVFGLIDKGLAIDINNLK